MAHILVVGGDPPELALAAKRGAGRTPAVACARALSEIAPGLTFAYAEPYFSDHDPDAIDMAAFDGMVVTGAGVGWSAASDQARPFRRMYELAFAAGAPCFGSCWGMQTAAVALGGRVQAGAKGAEIGVARGVRPADHPMMTGRRAAFDAITMHQDEVAGAPSGAVVTASNDHSAIQAFAYDQGGVSFWGVQYRPECMLTDVAHWLSRPGAAGATGASAADYQLIGEDPVAYARLAAKRRIGLDIIDRAYHLTELRNWLRLRVGA